MHAKYRLFNLLPILLGLIFFVWSQPYYVWHINHLLRAAISVIAGIIMYLNSNYKSSKYFVLFFVLLFYLSIAGGSNIFGVILAVLMVFVLSLKSDLLQRSFFAFYNIYTFITLLSILNFIFLAIGISLPSKTIEALNPEFDYTFTAYPFMVIADNLALFRFRGVYEEPGNLGTMAIFLLGINKFKFDNWKSYVIFISGILSLSLFFYLSMVVVFSIKIITSRNFKLAIVSLFIYKLSCIFNNICGR